MKTCENCMYWKILKFSAIDDKDFNTCSKIKEIWNYIDNPYDSKLDERAKDMLAFTEDAEGYHSSLITRKDFYCKLWSDYEN